jgi:hypothetical protein
MLPRSYRVTFALGRLLAAAPDLTLRDGAKALPLAQATYQTRASPASAETVAMALAELGRCAEAVEKQREAIALAQEGAKAGVAAANASLAGLETALEVYAAGPPCRYGIERK